MKAWTLHAPGGPQAFTLEELPLPQAKPDWVRIRIKAFGLNRSEHFTRMGDSPSVELPRVLGIECVGVVDAAPGSDLNPGQTVAAMMGGMGREFDGSYAEYTLVPRASVFPLQTTLPWSQLGALPEMLQTCNGSLHIGLGVQSGETLLIRGGTSSIGLATLAIARSLGVRVWSTSRSQAKVQMLLDAGAERVLIDGGRLLDSVRELAPGGVDHLLELIGASTLKDSLQCVRPGGVVCMTGILGGEWVVPDFEPMMHIPSGVRLSSYSGGASDISPEQLQTYVSLVESGELQIQTGEVWGFDQLTQAHQAMDANRSKGKMVVRVP
ncbi:MAG: NADPH2:quinone reductase [Cognaticolwellia sp.]|jgi:NADPH2:quinone reductase